MTVPQTPDSSPQAAARQAPQRVGPDRATTDRATSDRATSERVAPERVAPPRVAPDRAHSPGSPSGGAGSADPPSGGEPTSRQAAVPAAPDAGGSPTARQPAVSDEGRVRRPGPPRPGTARGPGERPSSAKPSTGRTRKARLALKRIDPWTVFLFSLLASVFMGIALIVAVAALFMVLESLGVVSSINELVAEVTGEGDPLLTTGRLVGGAAVLGAINIVLLTLLATLGAVLYNLCASLTGGIELTLGERDG